MIRPIRTWLSVGRRLGSSFLGTGQLTCLPLRAAAEVNSLTSSETELPYNYYTLPFCKPPEGVKKSLSSINPGTILMGSRIENSPYNFSMLVRGPAARPRAPPPASRVDALNLPPAAGVGEHAVEKERAPCCLIAAHPAAVGRGEG